ncbi:pre-rRNA processing protein-like protein Utp22 [Tricladium varicosporioides]|nr:pre-rRNA processing protein-like protein Utp22 [Hymenoscyphus varicosporioides]
MTSIPSKRRKLDHETNNPSKHQHDMMEEESSLDDLEVIAPTPPAHTSIKPTQSLGRHGLRVDDSALYAEGIYKSSMFKLQTDLMLAEVQPNYEKRFDGANEVLRNLKTWIEAIDSRDAVSVGDAIKALQKPHKIAIPFPEPKPDHNAAYKLAFAPPTNINVVGSYILKTMLKADTIVAIDTVVIMPASIFQDKDYLNYRYFYKRAYYLACIAAGLQMVVPENYVIKFKYLNGNPLHPILCVKLNSSGFKLPVWEIRIIPAAPQGFFSESKLRPNKNAIRQKDAAETSSNLPPTPFYNASLRSDGNYESYLKLLHSASNQSNSFIEASLLGRIWLRQRNFGSCVSKGGFGHFEWAATTALLLKGGGPKGRSILSPGYSSYQLFKAMLQFLSTRDLSSKPLVYQSLDFTATKSDMPMLFDGPRGQNLLYKMTPWSYSLLRAEATASVEMLNDETFDQFEAAFVMNASQPLERFDCHVCIPLPSHPIDLSTGDHITQRTLFSRRVYEILREGLMDRVQLININTSIPLSWQTKAQPAHAPEEPIKISVIFDPSNIDRLVDHGPSADEKKSAAKFQKFWGEKAELRRFKDGSILESLIWKVGSPYSIFQEIVSHLLNRHLGAEVSKDLVFIGEGFTKALPAPNTSAKSFESLKQAFNTFEKDVRDLEGLPLQLRQLSSISSQLRYASIDPPAFGPQNPLSTPADVLVQFEGSGRWPDDIVAIQRTKIAFLLKIGDLLQSTTEGITTRIGLENENLQLQNCAFLDVIYESGAAFRLRIHNDREQTLLERLIKDKATDPRTREDATLALSLYRKMFVQLPLLTQSISTHCTRYPLLSPTIRLLKLWFDRHMLSGLVSEEFVELLATRTFLRPYPWRAPSSVMTGFLRTLDFLERWDWLNEPLIVDFTGIMTRKDVASIQTRLDAWRKIDPAMNRTVLLAASNHDTTGVAFTDRTPLKVIATRMSALASSAMKVVREKGLELDYRTLFVPLLTDYDFVIHISPKFAGVQRRKEGSRNKFKNLEMQREVDHESVGYQPVQLYLEELNNLYSSSIVFFHSSSNETTIGGLWNPQTVSARPFKVNLTYTTMVVEEEKDGGTEEIELDKSATLLEIVRLGGDMITAVEKRR